mmetsp:Transcript_175559/g.563029  ORF Transcript_175559/g.563029 Transcript_175559/m.563029 type:complete len:301 (+) Transcript_175559:1250-2152(+)
MQMAMRVRTSRSTKARQVGPGSEAGPQASKRDACHLSHAHWSQRSPPPHPQRRQRLRWARKAEQAAKAGAASGPSRGWHCYPRWQQLLTRTPRLARRGSPRRPQQHLPSRGVPAAVSRTQPQLLLQAAMSHHTAAKLQSRSHVTQRVQHVAVLADGQPCRLLSRCRTKARNSESMPHRRKAIRSHPRWQCHQVQWPHPAKLMLSSSLLSLRNPAPLARQLRQLQLHPPLAQPRKMLSRQQMLQRLLLQRLRGHPQMVSRVPRNTCCKCDDIPLPPNHDICRAKESQAREALMGSDGHTLP